MKMLTLRVFVALSCAGLLVACHSGSLLHEPVGIFYTTENSQGVTSKPNELRVKNLRLAPWALTMPLCNDCRVALTKFDSPSGASQVISLSKDNQIYWAFINGKTAPYQTDIGRFSYVANQLYLQTDPQQPAIEFSEPITVEDCRYQLLWLQQPPDVAAGISNEQPAVHYQVLYSCD